MRSFLESAILQFSSKSVNSRSTTSNRDYAPRSDPIVLIFGHSVQLVLLYLCCEFEVIRPSRSRTVRRGFVPYRRLETE